MLLTAKYCIVVPHRNVPELLLRCIQSIPKLPYVHVLVVDNSDSDKRAKECLKGRQFGFGGLTLLEREPRGVGYIRNEALRYLREQGFLGKLVFADSDDYFLPNTTECFERFKNTDYDLVWFDMEGRDEQGNATNNADLIKRAMAIFFDDNDDGAFRYNCGLICGKFIDMGLVVKNDIWFPEIETCEDTVFSAKIGYYAEKIFVCREPLYVYVQHEGSLVMTNTAAKAKQGCMSAYDTTNWLKERSEKGYYWTQYDVIWHWMNWCQLDKKAWDFFPKVYRLCDRRSARKGAIKVLKRSIKTKLNKYRLDNERSS